MLATLFGFQGRLSRAGFIEVLLSVLLVDVAVVLAAKYLQEYGLAGAVAPGDSVASGLAVAAPVVLALFTAWTVLAATAKRAHDRNRTGWLVLLAIVPVVGWAWLLIDLFALKGTKGRNAFGRAPLGADHDASPVASHSPDEAVSAVLSAAAGAAHADHGHDAHAHDAHDDHGHADHGHEDHGHDGHGHDAHGHDDHAGHAVAAAGDHDDDGHGDHGADHHDAGHHAAAAHADDHHGHDDHDDHGHDDHAHDDHGHHAPADHRHPEPAHA